ncbi:MAG: hypothetical protein AAB268_12305, partial [Elusimicrobiota bacterium]
TIKYVPFTIACALRGLGFRVMIMAERQGTDGEALKKEWRKLSPRSFIFTPDPGAKHLHMQEGHFIAFFGDSDQDMLEAKKVNVLAVRIRRGKHSVKNNHYSPGKMGETVIPLSQF